MSHLRQVGGKRIVKGTTIAKEIRKAVFTFITVIALAAVVGTKATVIKQRGVPLYGKVLGLVKEMLRSPRQLFSQ
jgi:hypothetical protein